MIPNLAAAMSESPQLIEAFATLREQLETRGTFAAAERELVSLLNAVENGCRYCTAIHATFGAKLGLPTETIDRVRAKQDPTDPRHAALIRFARQLLRQRGAVAATDVAEFLAGGFSRAQALELIARLALSVMANYSGHLTHAPIDDALIGQYR